MLHITTKPVGFKLVQGLCSRIERPRMKKWQKCNVNFNTMHLKNTFSCYMLKLKIFESKIKKIFEPRDIRAFIRLILPDPPRCKTAALTLLHVPLDQEASDLPSMNTASESSVQAFSILLLLLWKPLWSSKGIIHSLLKALTRSHVFCLPSVLASVLNHNWLG